MGRRIMPKLRGRHSRTLENLNSSNLPVDENVIRQHNELMNFEWKTEKCAANNGKCWCAIIATKKKVYWYPKNDKDEAYICAAGCMPKELAKHIVKIHNQWLKTRAV